MGPSGTGSRDGHSLCLSRPSCPRDELSSGERVCKESSVATSPQAPGYGLPSTHRVVPAGGPGRSQLSTEQSKAVLQGHFCTKGPLPTDGLCVDRALALEASSLVSGTSHLP